MNMCDRTLGAGADTNAQDMQGRVVQVDPMKPVLKAPIIKHWTLKCDETLTIFAFKINLRHYSTATQPSTSPLNTITFTAGAYTRPLLNST